MVRVLIPLILAHLLPGCSTSEMEGIQVIQLSDEVRQQDQQQISEAIGLCLRQNYLKVEQVDLESFEVAKQLRGLCEMPFAALRLAKLDYRFVPEVDKPPTWVVEDEIKVSQQMVEKMRVKRKEFLRKHLEQFKNRPNLQHRFPSEPDSPSNGKHHFSDAT